MYTGPPPAAPTYPSPATTELNILTWSIIQSSNKLFFILNSISQNEACKWRLVCIAFQESMSAYPSCLQDGHFLLKFYICHPSDSYVNAINKHFWLQYHSLSKEPLIFNRQTPYSVIWCIRGLPDTSSVMSLLEMAQLDTSQYIYPCPLQVCYHSRTESTKPYVPSQWGCPESTLRHVPYRSSAIQFPILFNSRWPQRACHFSRCYHISSTDSCNISS